MSSVIDIITKEPSIAFDFDGVINIMSPSFPQVTTISPMHVLLIKYLLESNFRVVCYTARLDLCIVRNALSRENLKQVKVVSLKPDVKYFVDDRAVGSVVEPFSILEELVYRGESVSPYGFERFLSKNQYIRSHFQDNYIKIERDHIEVITPLFDQSVTLIIPRSVHETFQQRIRHHHFEFKNIDNTLSLLIEGVDVSKRLGLTLHQIMKHYPYYLSKGDFGVECKKITLPYPILPMTVVGRTHEIERFKERFDDEFKYEVSI